HAGRLWVVAASEVRRSGVRSAQAARREFGARLAITGSIQRDAEQVTVTLNLVDTVSLRQLRSRVLSISGAELPRLQSAAVTQVAEMLDLQLPAQRLADLRRGQTAVPLASARYLEGRGHLRRYEQRENVERAIDCFDRALTADPTYALAAAALGEAEWRMYELTLDPERVSRATAACRRALELSDDLAATHLTLGMIHGGTGHPQQAVAEFQLALARDSANADAYRELAGAYEAQGRAGEAEATYRRAIELRPNSWAGHNNLGRFYFRQGRYPEAAERFRQLIALTPDNARGYSSLGAVYILMDRWDAAREMLGRSLQIEPTYVASTNLGTLCFQQARYAEAAEAYEQAVAFTSQADHRTWGNLGSCYDRLGRPAAAREAFERAVRLATQQRLVNPRDPDLPGFLAVYREMLGHDSLAASLLAECMSLGPQSVETWFQAAHTFEKIGQRQRALDCLAEALERGYPLAKIERAGALEKLRADVRYGTLRRRFASGHEVRAPEVAH
ncbi:MAG: tetratricopeptide repeat protein, partial [Candidatus Eisenbacteria bacterium]|nr:tetratricopeptide repeat protein [Candidatus Eisenbacteria bacterium]